MSDTVQFKGLCTTDAMSRQVDELISSVDNKINLLDCRGLDASEVKKSWFPISTALLLWGWEWISPLGSDRQNRDEGRGMLLAQRGSARDGARSWTSVSLKIKMRSSSQTGAKPVVSTIGELQRIHLGIGFLFCSKCPLFEANYMCALNGKMLRDSPKLWKCK